MKKKVLFCGALVLLGSLWLSGCGARSPESLQCVDTAMGTVITQQIYMTEPDEAVAEEIIAVIDELENSTLSWRIDSSDLARVNRAAGDLEGNPLSPRLEALLHKCQEVSKDSGGAFDITIGEVARLWDIDRWAAGEGSGDYQLPKKERIRELLADAGYAKLRLSDHRLYLPQGMSLDMGAIGKGAALDEILALMEENEQITGAVISVGGSVLTYGEKPDGSAWSVGIADPADTSHMVGTLSLTGQWCISTSGDYERYVEVDGVRYHHIIDPTTGYPADSGVSSVTILAKDGALSDALSTACFILGEEKGLLLAKRYGVEALFVDKVGNISMTEGMKLYFR
ncbi:MAG: FAD:protein FMN transferase [Acetatifactor sp.]|nr:FAD:protein FMN transferase [Acetatifactor sp.]